MQFGYEIIGGDFSSAGQASSDVKKILKQLNIDPQVVRKIAVAVYEAEVNVVAHAYKGVMQVELDARRIRIVLEDEVPALKISGGPCRRVFPRHRKRSARWGLVRAWDCPT